MPLSSAMRAMRRPFLWPRSQPVRVFSVTGTSTARTTLCKIRCYQLLILQQRRAGQAIADFLGRTTHVDIDDLRTGIDVAARRLGHHRRIVSGDLHDARARLAGMVHAPARFRRVPQAHVGAEHLGCSKSRAKSPAENAKGAIGDARHGREQHDGGQQVGSDLQGWRHRGAHCLACGAASAAQRIL